MSKRTLIRESRRLDSHIGLAYMRRSVIALGLTVLFSLLVQQFLFAQQPSSFTSSITVIVHDQDERQMSSLEITLTTSPASQVVKHLSVIGGEAEFKDLAPGKYDVTVSSPGFQETTQKDISLLPGKSIEVTITLYPAANKQQITVNANADGPSTRASTTTTELSRDQVKNLPSRPATVAETLPLVPGVVRGPDGEIEISGASEKHSAMLVNSADVTDPATGQFGPTVPIDSVETVGVSKTPYLAQYGRFTAGVVTVETRRGGDEWHYELNDPLPEFRIRSLHLHGLRAMSPRFSINGPFIKNRLYFAQGLEYSLSKNAVRTLQFPFNENKKTSLNSFSQFDLLLSSKHTLTGTFHLVPSTSRYVNLDFFNPQPVTPNIESHDYTVATIDRLDTRFGLLLSTVNLRRAHAEVFGQGYTEMVLTPVGNSGNYFAQQARAATRVDWIESLSLHPISAVGVHNIQIGTTIASSGSEGQFTALPVTVQDTSGRQLKRIDYIGDGNFDRNDWEYSSYIQDHWTLHPRLAFDIGIRWEHQTISGSSRVAPRTGFSWSPFRQKPTVIRGGIGLFYEHVPLSVYAFSHYPEQVVTTFGPTGTIVDGPRRFVNITDVAADSDTPFRDEDAKAGNFAPHTLAWNLEAEHPLFKTLTVRANYLQSNGNGLLTLSPRIIQGMDALVLGGNGSSHYRQLELTAKLSLQKERYFYFSYVRSQARGDHSDANTFLGNFPQPIVQGVHFTNSTASVPHRILMWGEYALPWKLRIYPLIEIRSGFPYAVRDAAQDYVGIPYSDKTRFPMFISLDTSLSKDFQLNLKYAVRLTVRGLNLTNHFNPLTVHANTADPKFGTFFGNYNRRFRLDFDVLF